MPEDTKVYYPPELTYKSTYAPKGHIAYSKITPQVSGDVTVPTSGGKSSLFEIPSNVYNHYLSELWFTMTPAASTGTTYNYANISTIGAIQKIQLYSKNNVFLVDAGRVNKYLEAVNPYRYSLSELKENSFITGAGEEQQIGQYPHISNGTAGSVSTKTAAQGDNDGISYDSMAFVHPNSSTADSANPIINVRFQLGKLFHTLFEMNKEIYYPEILYLKIFWSPSIEMYFTSDSATDPTSNAAAVAGSVVLSNIYLYAARETNSEIIEKVQMATEGSTFWIDRYQEVSIDRSGTVQNHSFPIDGSFGINLKRIYYVLWNQNETANTMYDHDNDSDAKYETFHTEMDGRRLQEYDLDTSINEDYYYLKGLLKNTCIRNAKSYALQSVWIDHWDNFEQLDNAEQGMPLDRQYMYQWKSTTASATHIHSAYVVTQRKMTIANGLILLDNSL